MKTKPYNDNSRKPENWTDKKLQAWYRQTMKNPADPHDGVASKVQATIGAEIMRRRRVAFSK